MLRSTSAYDAHSSIIETSEFIFQLKRNLDATLMNLPQTDQLAKLSLEAINQIALQTDSALPALLSDPASALRTLENRSNLQDVNLAVLQTALCQHYGIPPKLAEIVAQCWGAAITEVRQADNWHTPARMHLALKTALATNLDNKLHAYDATFAPATISRQRSIVRDLLAWCETMQVERSESIGKHARRAEASPAPLSKKPRNE